MSRALFVSDIHITSPDDSRAELFGRFLDKCLSLAPEHLFLVGDIFDFWIADRSFFVAQYSALIEKLVELKRRGTEIHYFEGNHDLDLKLYWQHKLGFDVQDSPAFYTIDGRVVRVEHGDQMDPEDRGYLFLRWLLRTPVVRTLGRVLPNFFVDWLGRRASAVSRDYTTQVKVASDEEVREKIRRHAVKVFGDKPFDFHISGHVHVSENSVQKVDSGSFHCINLGTWLKEPMVLDLFNGKPNLISIESLDI